MLNPTWDLLISRRHWQRQFSYFSIQFFPLHCESIEIMKMSTVKIEKWKHVCASKEKKDKVTHTFPFFLWLIHWHICCSFSISSQILRTTKRLSRLILSILCSYFFFYSAESTLTTSKKSVVFPVVWKESLCKLSHWIAS